MYPQTVLLVVRIANILICAAGVYPATRLLRLNWRIRHETGVSAQTRAWLWWLGVASVTSIALGGAVWTWHLIAFEQPTFWPGIVYGLNTIALDAALYTLMRLSKGKR